MGFVGGDLVDKRVRNDGWKFWEKGGAATRDFRDCNF